MSSAQVLPNSRKQEHLAAGKRRLEEFRKKKAAERAKKTNEKQPTVTQIAQHTVSNETSAQIVPDEAVVHQLVSESSSLPYEFEQKKEQDPVVDAQSDFPSVSDRFPQSTTNSDAIKDEYKKYENFRSGGPLDYSYSQENKEVNGSSEFSSATYNQENDKVVKGDSAIHSASPISHGFISDQPTSRNSQPSDATDGSSGQSTNLVVEEYQSKERKSNFRDSLFTSPSSSRDVTAKTSPQSLDSSLYAKFSNASTATIASTNLSSTKDALQPISTTSFASERMQTGKIQDFNKSDLEQTSLMDTSSALEVVQSAAYTSEYSSTDLSSAPNQASLYTSISETRRSRPSFLDSLNVPRVSPPIPSRDKFVGNGPGLGSQFPVESSIFRSQSTTNSSSLPNNGHSLVDANDHTERKPDFYLPKQDEDFSALEQHIEDLTQEKFSLQRALEASRVLTESLATENSSLTDSYNQQRNAFNQLKADMEKFQEEISLQLAELEAIRNEYANAKLECNAADERAKLLAAEVIGLEEKALRLRSNELKLERQLENSYEELGSYRKKVGNLEKERMDFQSTISALQEEKKVLQAKWRKASASGKLVDKNKNSTNKKDISTSTEDLGGSIETSDQQVQQARSLVGNEASSSATFIDDVPVNLEASFVQIPPDQMRTIENINILISELTLEKDELMKRLATETSESSRVKDLNKELSRRLEVQTQRLELLTAQSMAANANLPAAKEADTNTVYDNSNVYDNTAYADEGDEVVERVLGWIMKLFPGGPSRRRTSKLL